MADLWINRVKMPSPVALSQSGEVIWSSNTGRSTGGKMIGDVVAEKETYSIQWGVLTAAEVKLIRDNAKAGFVPVKFMDSGAGVAKEFMMYRGTVTTQYLGCPGGTDYYHSTNLDMVEQ